MMNTFNIFHHKLTNKVAFHFNIYYQQAPKYEKISYKYLIDLSSK